MFELFLSKTPNKEASPAVARKPRHPAKKFSSQFLICAHRFFSSKRKRKLLCGVLLLVSRAAGLRFGSGEAEFPPHPPSASPSLPTALFSAGLKLTFYILNQFGYIVHSCFTQTDCRSILASFQKFLGEQNLIQFCLFNMFRICLGIGFAFIAKDKFFEIRRRENILNTSCRVQNGKN